MIKTNRLTIKQLSPCDRDAVKAIVTDETVKKTYMLPDLGTEEEITKMFERLLKYSRSRKTYLVGIYLGKKLIGFVNEVETEENSIELGYVINSDYHNHGYMTEALKAVIDALLQKGFLSVITGAFEENIASIKVMKKCGMKKINKEEDLEYRGKTHRCVYYAVSAQNK